MQNNRGAERKIIASNAASTTSSTLRLGGLTNDSKQRVWQHLINHHHDLAVNIQKASEHEVVKLVLQEFDGSLIIDANIIPEDIRRSLRYEQ